MQLLSITHLLPRQYTRSYKVSTVSFAMVLSAFCRDHLPVPLAGRFVVDARASYVSSYVFPWFQLREAFYISAILARLLICSRGLVFFEDENLFARYYNSDVRPFGPYMDELSSEHEVAN